MTDIPIIFSTPMVLALIAGRKTMTRRLAWRPARKGEKVSEGSRLKYEGDGFVKQVTGHFRSSPWQRVQPGDRLWVREAWKPHSLYAGMKPSDMPKTQVFYLADQKYEPSNVKGFPSIHMTRWASRLTLIITRTKVEPLQAITDADAQAEGIEEDDGSEPDIWYVPGAAKAGWKITMASRPAPVFKSLWIALHGEKSWNANPDVVALSFKVIHANIDQVSPPHRTHVGALARGV